MYIIYKKTGDGKSKLVTHGLDIHQNEQVSQTIEKLVRSLFDDSVPTPVTETAEAPVGPTPIPEECLNKTAPIETRIVEALDKALATGIMDDEVVDQLAKAYIYYTENHNEDENSTEQYEPPVEIESDKENSELVELIRKSLKEAMNPPAEDTREMPFKDALFRPLTYLDLPNFNNRKKVNIKDIMAEVSNLKAQLENVEKEKEFWSNRFNTLVECIGNMKSSIPSQY
jgi:hypothetical protein